MKRAVTAMNHLVFDKNTSIILSCMYKKNDDPIHLLMLKGQEDHAKALRQWEVLMSTELCAHLMESFVLNKTVSSPIHWRQIHCI